MQIETTKTLQWLYDNAPVNLNEKQRDFLEHFIFKSSGHGCLVGIAGAGKSTLLTCLKMFYGDKIVFFGSSGISSQNMPNGIGMGTAHSGLSLSIKPATELNYRKVSQKTSGLFNSALVEVIVIDEAYLLNSDNLDLIWRRIERFNRKNRNRPERNIRLLLCGDPCQAVTVMSDEDVKREIHSRWNHHLMFKSTVWDRFDFTYYLLDKVERQEDKVYKACLDVIRYNQKGRFDNCLKWLNQRVEYDYPEDTMILAATNKTVDKINNAVLARNPNRKFTFKPIIKKDFNIKDTLVREEGVTICVGQRVMTIVNCPEGTYQNGSTGVITLADTEGCIIKFDHSGEQVRVNVHKWENKEHYVESSYAEDGSTKEEMKERVVGTMLCLPVLPSSCVSIMKSQGLTIKEKYVLDVEDSYLYTWDKLKDFGQNFVYLGLSRGTDINNLILARPISPQHIKCCEDSINFWFECKEKSVI
ncbi:accessory helicase [Vibrio phage ICP1]|nr:putative helicase [Vibrio phage ICP1_2004_A]ASV41469.1 5'-3' DNA helicase-like protein [Vibrio phage JSF6]ASV42518.1 5'-3' DNA helicase-like protein [Vibrio phage JSF14]AXQ70773.1 putative helicase [Vibrio phage ICP1_2006_E]AXQ70989.1 putative helicase [Vibrio phage ICP1_2012_A]AXY82459.1 putative helicase [Vibrio phage ICP1_2011_B]QHB43499.1 putative helicase [Vibrio phage VMJ710]QVV97315.1 accessory helicase [Vibrio phage ICP1]HAS2539977.1 AAA family ATPase [Vibrio cholerae]HAT7621768